MTSQGQDRSQTVRVSGPTQFSAEGLIRAHYAFQSGGFISDLTEDGGGIQVSSSVSRAPIWNHAAWLGDSLEQFEQFLGELAARPGQHRPVIYLDASATAELTIASRLGFEKFEEEVWMVGSPAGGSISGRVRVISNAREFTDFCAVFAPAFGVSDNDYQAGLQSKGDARNFVLYAHGRPVSVGTLISAGLLGSIYNIGTDPQQRQKGYAQELVRHLMAVAARDNCERVFLQVENHTPARLLYEKLGFTTGFVRHGLHLREWHGSRGERPLLAQVLGERDLDAASRVGRESRVLPFNLEQSVRVHFPEISVAKFVAAAWGYLLHRYVGLDQVRFKVREHVERECLISVQSECSVRDWLASVTEDADFGSIPDTGTSVSLGNAAQPGFRELSSGALDLQLLGEPPTSIQITYRADYFSKEAIRRMSSHFVTVLDSMLSAPDGRVSEVEILPEAERHQLLVEWNQRTFVATESTFSRIFEEQVERTPDAIALVLASTGEHFTYRQLNRRANRLAHRLREMGVSRGVPVAVLLERSLEMIVALLGVFKSGGVWVPIDSASPAERVTFLLHDIEAGVFVSSPRLMNLAGSWKGPSLALADAGIAQKSDKNLSSASAPADPAYIIYTSGSTGQPKGVVVSHYAIANHVLDCRKSYGLSGHDKVLQFSSLSFDAALEQILPALCFGASLIVRGEEIWPPREFGEVIQRFQATVADVPTPYWHELTDYWAAQADPAPLRSLRLMIVGGEALSPEKAALWRKTANVRLINAYGPTETIITATSAEVAGPGGDGAAVCIGRPRGDRKAYVLDSRGRPCPMGIPGELYLGGSLLASGYYKQPKLTAARFLQNPFTDDPDARIYKTGDLVRYREDGNLQYLGRLDEQVKIRGYRIELGEIEAVLCKHPSVREAVVVARGSESEQKYLYAYVTGASATEAHLRSYLKKKLPAYMIPRRIIRLKEWPLLPSGKIDRRALPDAAEAAGAEGVAGPREPLELQLQLLFERVLKKAPVGIDQSFFELGGDSLQALELLVQIEKGTGKQLPLGTLYQASTVEALARELRRRVQPGEWSSLVPLQAGGSRPPFFLLHTTPGDVLGYGNLVYRLGPEQPCYGFQSLGLKDANLSHTSIQEMARYYVDLLRRFQPNGPYYLGGWCYGGVLAVEMARLLTAQGQPIGLLALLETVAMPAQLTNSRYYLHRASCLLRMSPGRWLTYAREKVKFNREARVANRMRFRQVSEGAAPRDARLVQLEHVYNTNLRALGEYRSSYYDGTVTLFNAAEQDPAVIADSFYGWVGLAREIRIHQVPGNHDSMLTEPNVSILAEELTQALRKAQERKPGP